MDEGHHRPGFPLISWAAYNAIAVPTFVAAMQLGRFVNEKARVGMDGRRRMWARLDLQQEKLRGAVWFHASSAGEYEQARPLIRAFIERTEGQIPTLLTVFSPSGYAHATQHPETDVIEYLPLDGFVAAERMLERIAPRALVFVRYDCWPNLVWSAHRRRIPTVLIGASLHAGSARLKSPARAFFSSVYQRIDAIGAIDEADAHRFRTSFRVAPNQVTVTGDTRVDQVVRRHADAADTPLPKALSQAPWNYIVMGSTWPADDAVVLEPALDALGAHDTWGLIIAPHEPTPAHLAVLEKAISDRGMTSARLSELVELKTGQRRSTAAARDDQRWRIILVDTIGVLASIYRAGSIAWVGGGFTTGVHSTLEPAVCGLPVLFGPRHSNAVEARLLIERGGGRSVDDLPSARRELLRLIEDDATRAQTGERAAAMVQAQSGATERSLELLMNQIER